MSKLLLKPREGIGIPPLWPPREPPGTQPQQLTVSDMLAAPQIMLLVSAIAATTEDEQDSAATAERDWQILKLPMRTDLSLGSAGDFVVPKKIL